jgi:translation elongation factor EF-1alpha
VDTNVFSIVILLLMTQLLSNKSSVSATISNLIASREVNEKGEIVEKKDPKFVRSNTKISCVIKTRIPICIEKHQDSAALGRFTLRDEGR